MPRVNAELFIDYYVTFVSHIYYFLLYFIFFVSFSQKKEEKKSIILIVVITMSEKNQSPDRPLDLNSSKKQDCN